MKEQLVSKLVPVIVFMAVVLALPLDLAAEDEVDPVLEYYWEKAGETAIRLDPTEYNISYSYTATTLFHDVDGHGEKVKTDSLLTDFFYTGRQLDSAKVRSGEEKLLKKLSLAVPRLFEDFYYLNFFPNDTGGEELAIGLITDSTAVAQPDGLVVIDRKNYHLRKLYLYYPDVPGHLRQTRSYRFTLEQGFVFPDSVWEVGVVEAVFGLENYRIETGITNIQVTISDRNASPEAEPDAGRSN